MKICPLCEKELGDEFQRCPEDDADLMPLIVDPLIGSVIEDRYRITNVIGVGSMGIVYRAVQEAVGREVAIKVLPKELASNRQAVKRFHHEAKAASRLNHPHIITVYDFGIAGGGRPFIAMELLDGITMDKYLQERKRLELVEALPIIQQMCEGIGEAHKQGLIHRDIKPANIALVERAGRKNHVIILDFGIAKGTERVNDADATAPGVVFGSPVYMSPERFLGQSGDARSDVYSLAVVIFQMLSGAVPFKSNDLINLISSHVIAAPPTVSGVNPDAAIPGAMEQAIQRALAKNPADRPQSMQEFWEDIHRACKPRAVAPNAVQEGGPRPVDVTGNESTHDVFKRLEAVLSDPVSAAAASDVAAAAAVSQQTSASPQASVQASPTVSPPVDVSSKVSSALASADAIARSTAAATAGAAPPRPYRNSAATASGQMPTPEQSSGSSHPASGVSSQADTLQPGTTRDEATGSAIPSEKNSSRGQSQTSERSMPGDFRASSSGRLKPTPYGVEKPNDSASGRGLVLTLSFVGCLIAAGVMFAMSALQPPATPKYAQTLLSQGKLDEAGHALAMMRSDSKKNDGAALDNLSMALAREYVRINRLPAAIQSLQQIPPSSPHYDSAQSSIKKYRDKLGI